MAGTICPTAAEYITVLKQVIDRIQPESIDALADRLFEAWRDDQQVFVFGNGGSAYTASHFITDMVKTASVDGKKRLRAISLVDNYGLTTALGNDIHYDKSFVFPLETFARSGDLAIAISGSGNSPNVVLACEWAKRHGLTMACLTGFGGGKIADMADIHINVPSDNYGVIEDLHLSVGHMICHALRSRVAHASE
jgi:D-sedoheptulose 7-phosphate isomerase